MNAIELQRVRKSFGDHAAVTDLSLIVPVGGLCGLIGPNGSGKTTTIRMVMNILTPDVGMIRVFGQPSASSVRDDIGYLPEERGLYKRMTVRQVLRYYGRLKGRAVAEVDAEITRWLGRLRLAEWGDHRVQALSKGMSQKVQFISAVVSRPKLVILDEPFSGLDPVNADLLRDAVLELRNAGTTVVFSTHDMMAAERLCDRIVMIFKGQKVLDGTLEEIQSQYGHDTVRVRTASGAAALTGLSEVESVVDLGNVQDVRLRADPQAFLQRLAARTAVYHFEMTKPSLHDIFLRIARPTAEDLHVEAGVSA